MDYVAIATAFAVLLGAYFGAIKYLLDAFKTEQAAERLQHGEHVTKIMGRLDRLSREQRRLRGALKCPFAKAPAPAVVPFTPAPVAGLTDPGSLKP